MSVDECGCMLMYGVCVHTCMCICVCCMFQSSGEAGNSS